MHHDELLQGPLEKESKIRDWKAVDVSHDINLGLSWSLCCLQNSKLLCNVCNCAVSTASFLKDWASSFTERNAANRFCLARRASMIKQNVNGHTNKMAAARIFILICGTEFLAQHTPSSVHSLLSVLLLPALCSLQCYLPSLDSLQCASEQFLK